MSILALPQCIDPQRCPWLAGWTTGNFSSAEGSWVHRSASSARMQSSQLLGTTHAVAPTAALHQRASNGSATSICHLQNTTSFPSRSATIKRSQSSQPALQAHSYVRPFIRLAGRGTGLLADLFNDLGIMAVSLCLASSFWQVNLAICLMILLSSAACFRLFCAQ